MPWLPSTFEHKRTGFRTWGSGDFLARKIYAIPEFVIVEIGMPTHSNYTNSKNKLVHNFFFRVWRDIFRARLISLILDFSGFAGKKREFGFQTLLVGITFRGFHVQYLKVTKIKAIWWFLFHCLQPISLQFSEEKRE